MNNVMINDWDLNELTVLTHGVSIVGKNDVCVLVKNFNKYPNVLLDGSVYILVLHFEAFKVNKDSIP